MNKKLVRGSLAGVAAIALAAGGTTFAAWSDFDVQQSGAGAGILKLTVSHRDGSTIDVKPFSLAPGQNKYQTFYLASADADNVPVGHLTAHIERLNDSEDTTSPNCTTKSEAIAEGSAVDANGLPTQMNICGTDGELSQEAYVQILTSTPVDGPTSCGNNEAQPGNPYISTNPAGAGLTLGSAATKTFNLGDLSKGQGLCVRMEMTLPDDNNNQGRPAATNASQGDQASWNWRFDLAQL